MVVDDDPIFRLLVGRVAQQLGQASHLLLCTSLAAAEQVREQADFWAIDVNLPDGQGPEWVKTQRKLGYQQPVLFLSHGDFGHDLLSTQPSNFSRKPATLDGLRQLMQGWWT